MSMKVNGELWQNAYYSHWVPTKLPEISHLPEIFF